jgi:hypothetical protein
MMPNDAQAQSIIEAGVLAPSADNRHMLRFRIAADAILVRGSEEFERAPFHRRVLALISLGAVLENMVLRAAALGVESEVTGIDGGRAEAPLAELRFRPVAARADPLEAAIRSRHTNRRPFYRGPPLSEAERRQMTEDAEAVSGVRLLWLDSPDTRRQALRLVTIAETERFRCKSMHADLFSSVRFDVGWRGTASEGLPPGALEIEPPMRPLFKALRNWSVMRTLNLIGTHHFIGLRGAYLPCRTAPHLCALTTSLDLDRGTVAVGRALQRVWLRAASFGMAFQPFAGAALLALEGYRDVAEATRQRLRSEWMSVCGSALPLMMFRIGRAGRPSVRSARPDVADLLVRSASAAGSKDGQEDA